jgi:hypothetical protein
MTNRAARAASRVGLPIVLLIVGGLAPSASAANRQRLQVGIDRLSDPVHGGARPVALHFRLSRWTDEGAISSPARDDRFYLPRAYSLKPSAVPFCDVNALAHRGPAACRAASVGSGTLRVAMSGKQPLAAGGSVTVYNTPPVHRHPTTLTYVLVPTPVRSEFWFQSVMSATRHGLVIEVRETRLNLYGAPLTVTGLDFTFGRIVGHGKNRRSYLSGPANCGPPASRTFGLRTTFYDRFLGPTLDRPAGQPLFTAEAASC